MQALAKDFSAGIRVTYRVECLDARGRLKWRAGFANLVVTEGRNALLNRAFNAPAGDVNWYVGLKGAGTVDAADTLASHGGWTEITAYSGDRKAWTKNGAATSGAMSNSSSKAQFTASGATTVAGAFLASAETGSSGILFGAGNFGSPRELEENDVLNVQVDLSVAAA